MAALFCVNNVMDAILKLWRHIRNPTPSIFLLEKQSCQISPRSDFKLRSLRLFLKRSPNKNNNNNNKSNITLYELFLSLTSTVVAWWETGSVLCVGGVL